MLGRRRWARILADYAEERAPSDLRSLRVTPVLYRGSGYWITEIAWVM